MTSHMALPRPAHYRVRHLQDTVDRLQSLAARRFRENTALTGQLAKQLQEHEALWQVLGDVSHELRTPMNGILGYTDLLLDTDLDDTQQAFTQLLRVSANHLLTLVNNVLDWSSLSSGALTIDCLEFNLRVLVEEVADTLAVLAEQKSVTLASRFDRQLPATVLGDPQYLRQILLNLVGNAIKFTDVGEVVVAVEPAPETTPVDGGWVRISVSDTGPGVAIDQQALIFERFTRIESDRSAQGTGLGLSIARDLVAQMGGRIGVSSTPGEGAVFWMDLPLPEGSTPPADSLPRVDIGGMRVLVADANATYRRILTTMLTGLGATCHAVADGQSALDALGEEQHGRDRFDVVVMDLVLTDMDGADLARLIHQNEAFRGLPLVVLTGMTRRRQAQELEALGCRGYLTKPVRQSVLRDVLVEVGRGVSSEKAAPLITRHSIKERRFRNVSVLVADDSIVNARLTAAMLKNEGYSVSVVTDGAQALDRVTRQLPDVVLLDLEMPVMGGLETVRAIRHWEASGGNSNPVQRLAVMAMTGHTEDERIRECMTAGFDSVLTKPFDAVDLIQALEWIANGDAASSPTPAAQPPTVPLDLGRALKKALGDHEFLESLVADFVLSTDEQMDAIAEAVSNGDAATVATGVHKIKGAAGNLYIHGVAEAAIALEATLADNGMASVHDSVADLGEAFETFKKRVNRPGWTSAETLLTESPSKGAT